MYTDYFGLQQEPFRAKFEGPGTYVGAQQARALSRITKALAVADAVVTVSGPVGVGKTTLVARAVQVVAPDGRVARIGRMRLGPDEIVELLLAQFGVSRQPRGTIQRFAAFKRLLDECAEDGGRAFIVVEDARRIGVDALTELEAMTAADSGGSGTANIVLMGDSQLQTLLADPLLQRLAQRTRARQTVGPFDIDELRGYLAHCVHLAGGEFDAIFEAGSVEMLHRCSDGIPRVVNNICETALTEAADADANRVSVGLLRDIARDVYGIDTLPPERVTPRADAAADEEDDLRQDDAVFSTGEYEPEGSDAAVVPVDDDSPTGVNEALTDLPDEFPGFEETMDEPAPADPSVVDDEELTVSEFSPSPTITIVDQTNRHKVVPLNAGALRSGAHESQPAERTPEATLDADETAGADAEGPTLDESAPSVEAADVEGAQADGDADTHEVPVLDDTSAVLALDEVAPVLEDDDIPVLTDSVLMPALDEDAAANPDEAPRDESAIETMTSESDEFSSALDELELAISSANEEQPAAGEEAPAADAAPGFEITLDRNLDQPPADDISRWQQELANAKSLDEMSDMLAETVFGDKDFDRVAAEITARGPAAPAAEPEAPSLGETGARELEREEPGPPAVAAEVGEPDGEASSADASEDQGMTGGFSMSISQRFEVLRKIGSSATKTNVVEITMGEERAAPRTPSALSPEPIESQIDTAITQSRLRLTEADIEKMKKERPVAEEKQSTGFLGLFKR